MDVGRPKSLKIKLIIVHEPSLPPSPTSLSECEPNNLVIQYQNLQSDFYRYCALSEIAHYFLFICYLPEGSIFDDSRIEKAHHSPRYALAVALPSVLPRSSS